LLRESYGERRGATQDYNMLRSLLDRPSRHIWFTFQDGYLWWCTVGDEVEVDRNGSTMERGHFWMKCDRPWSNRTLAGRLLSMADLPGGVTATAGYRATTCEPTAAVQIGRILRDEVDPDVATAEAAAIAHQISLSGLVRRLSARDFELLVDLLLQRSGWARIAKLGGTVEGVDVEVENAAIDEIAFVQVKSRANQAVLDDYVSRFLERRDRYSRMIFVVHTSSPNLTFPTGLPIHIWDIDTISRLSMRLGMSNWLASRF
jgi:hypothetical protein